MTQLDLLMKPERHFTRSRLGKINEATHTFVSGYFQYAHCSLHVHVWLFIEWRAMSLWLSKHAKCLAWVQLSFVDKTECKTVLLPNYWSCSLMAKSCSKTREFPSVLQSVVKVEHWPPSSVSLIHLKSYRNCWDVFVLFVLYKRDTCNNVRILQKQMNCC